MNQRAEDPMLGSPRFPTDDQLEELKLRVIDDDIVQFYGIKKFIPKHTGTHTNSVNIVVI